MSWLEWCELLSYVVTIVGFPFAILIFIYEQRKERRNEEEELHQQLSDEYSDFLKIVLQNADLQLFRRQGGTRVDLTDEQQERKFVLFGIVTSLFERAYIMVYEEDMDKQARRLWSSWEDYMREWCRRADYREALPELLEGEDEEFRDYIARLAAEETAR
jgi:hypothetical protein